jgi:short-subunit dehydrogenase
MFVSKRFESVPFSLLKMTSPGAVEMLINNGATVFPMPFTEITERPATHHDTVNWVAALTCADG